MRSVRLLTVFLGLLSVHKRFVNNLFFFPPCKNWLVVLKGTVSRDFRHFLFKKNSTWAPYEEAKTVSRNFSFSQRYSQKKCVHEVNDYADKLFYFWKSKKSKKVTKSNLKFSKIVCPRCRWLCGHGVPVDVDYMDMDKTTQTLSVNFEGFSQILKEHQVKKRFLGVFTNSIVLI